MPQQIVVSADLNVGGPPMVGAVKHFVGRREERVLAPITLLSSNVLKIGDGDTRQVISSTTMDGSVSYLRFRTEGPLMTRPIPAPHAAATGVRHAGRDPDACQEIWTSRVPLKPSPTRRKADQKNHRRT